MVLKRAQIWCKIGMIGCKWHGTEQSMKKKTCLFKSMIFPCWRSTFRNSTYVKPKTIFQRVWSWTEELSKVLSPTAYPFTCTSFIGTGVTTFKLALCFCLQTMRKEDESLHIQILFQLFQLRCIYG